MAIYIYSKRSGKIVNCYPDAFTMEEFAQGNESVYEAFDIMEYPEKIFPVNDYKIIDGLMTKILEDQEYTQSNYFTDKLKALKDENLSLGQQAVDLDLRLLMGGM